jgi:hypothetical protein
MKKRTEKQAIHSTKVETSCFAECKLSKLHGVTLHSLQLSKGRQCERWCLEPCVQPSRCSAHGTRNYPCILVALCHCNSVPACLLGRVGGNLKVHVSARCPLYLGRCLLPYFEPKPCAKVVTVWFLFHCYCAHKRASQQSTPPKLRLLVLPSASCQSSMGLRCTVCN